MIENHREKNDCWKINSEAQTSSSNREIEGNLDAPRWRKYL
jgi:hypothetical protein